jgi:hypothetical protein
MQQDDKTEVQREGQGRYLYCIAGSGEKLSLGAIGLDGSNVYTIPYRDICAAVHECPAEPYNSTDGEVVNSWVLAHQKVVDEAWERWGTVLPLGFDTIVIDKDGIGAEDNVRNWLQKGYDNLKSKMDKMRGKAEYGVQIFWEPQVIAQNLTKTSPEIRQLKTEIRSQPRGIAYLYKQKLENALKKELESKADQCFRDFYERIRRQVDDIVVEKTKPGDQNTQMIMNLSCLLPRDKAAELGEELGNINSMEGFSVRFTGPWPPYSFVGT